MTNLGANLTFQAYPSSTPKLIPCHPSILPIPCPSFFIPVALIQDLTAVTIALEMAASTPGCPQSHMFPVLLGVILLRHYHHIIPLLQNCLMFTVAYRIMPKFHAFIENHNPPPNSLPVLPPILSL